ncbi:MAG: hypothetical protein H6Q90_4534, partial [Deltaproteobacteria bacterium]|nr:hypothetical protein [Deltaproteobacteria bacterium]
MMTKKLLMFAVAGLLTPVAIEGAAHAGGRVTINKIIGAPETDTAPVANGRLRRTDSEQAGHEMAAIVLLGDGTKGLWFDMATELPALTPGGEPRRANHRVQASLIPFTLNQATDGAVQVTADLTQSKFVTDNDGDEYRNAHHIAAFALTKDIGCITYNFQQNGGNDTKRYTECFTADGTQVLNQSLTMAKNNDDCSTHQSGEGDAVTQAVGGKVYVVSWHGCNGNGSDDGWANFMEYDTTNPSAVTVKKMFDVSLAQREERTRGNCTVGTDPNTAICTWTEGNNQPARDGTWMAAIDITPGKFKGANAQGAIIWKEQIEGRKNIDGRETHSMRASQQRVFAPDATGALKATDLMIWYSNDNRGNNNTNEKGGYSVRTMMGVIKADKTGLSYVQPLADTSVMLRGLGGTHLGMVAGVFGTTDKLQPGVIFTNGSHTGGYFSGQARTLVWDQTALTFSDGGMTPTAV